MTKNIKKIMLIIILLIIISTSTNAYQEIIIRNINNKPVRVIKTILDGEHYIVSSLALEGGQSLEGLTRQVGGHTSINGTFFCPSDYNYCGGKTHSRFERIFLGNGKDYSMYRPDTGIRGIFSFDINGNPFLVQNNLGYIEGLNININSHRIDDIYFGLGNFPILLAQGSNVLRGSEKHIDDKMRTRGNKSFICSTKEKNTIYMGVVGGVNIYELADFISKSFDCFDAINLDAGASLSMIYQNNVLQKGGRKQIMDAFVILDKEQYIRLTGHTPPTKTPHTPSNDYKLNNEDLNFINAIDNFCKKSIRQKGEDQKRKFISFFRSLASNEKYQDNKSQKIYNEILIRLFTIDKL